SVFLTPRQPAARPQRYVDTLGEVGRVRTVGLTEAHHSNLVPSKEGCVHGWNRTSDAGILHHLELFDFEFLQEFY
ncbi:hypothetical protein, partial [Azospirillum endophyticum]|uniref:hypothetical protein n=1 Tax=Azospirillum endophyticum TaxID=2800326 RepID=UPI001B3BA6B7